MNMIVLMGYFWLDSKYLQQIDPSSFWLIQPFCFVLKFDKQKLDSIVVFFDSKDTFLLVLWISLPVLSTPIVF